jgi:putative transposase
VRTYPPIIYHGFPSKLHHDIPVWVAPDSIFHIRIRLDRDKPQGRLTNAPLGTVLLESAEFYESKLRLQIVLFLLMRDHIHALLVFQRDRSMSRVIGDWKRFHACNHQVFWQGNFFDHRLRNDERGEQLQAKVNYIRQNPVAAGLCARAQDWPWVIDRVTRVHS